MLFGNFRNGKKIAFLFILLFGFNSIAQNKEQLELLKKNDDYAEFIYVHLDAFSENKSVGNLIVFENLETKLWRVPNGNDEQIAFLFFYINYAYHLKEFGFINKSVLYYEKGYDFYKTTQIKNYDIIEYCLKPLANNYTRLGDANRAEDILKIIIEKAQQEQNTNQIIAGYSNLAIVSRTKGAINLAIKYLELALNLSDSKPVKSRLYSDLAMNYLLLNNLELAKKNVEYSISLNENLSTVSIHNFKTLGNVFLLQKNEVAAIKYFQKALKLAKETYGENNRQVAKIQNSIAESYSSLGKYNLSLQFYQNALKTLLPKYNPTSLFENPLSDYFYAENTLKESLDGRAIVFYKMNNAKVALQNYELSFLVEDELRSTYLTQNAKLLQQQENRNRAEECIDVCYQLYLKESDLKWLKEAFLFAEKTKSLVLLTAKEIALNKSKIKDDTLFFKERELNFKKAQLNKKIALEELKNEKAAIDLLANLTAERNLIFNKLKIVNQEIETKYPNLKKPIDSLVSMKKIRERLVNKSTVLIEFFEGKKNVYVFKIEKDKPISVAKIEADSNFKNDVLSFLAMFSGNRGVEIQNNINKYTALGHKLFKNLFNFEFSENVILIPDGIFSFLPFDALLTEKTTSRNFENLPYLIQKTTISYGYSAAILLQNKNESGNLEKKVLGFFPVFKKNHRGLAELNYTLEEAKNIENKLDGEFLIGDKAQKQTFNNLSYKYPVIHLSTHASAGDYYTPASIEFYDETLYLQEIYGYNFNADLLVLSACETGIGALKRGEGVLSLARGFSYAGVKNLIVSLWKVNDKSTAELITGFYQNYKKGSSKSKALHQSKLAYLSNTSISANKKSPYFWASFVYLGEANSVNNNDFKFYWLLIVAFIVAAGIFLYKNSSFGTN